MSEHRTLDGTPVTGSISGFEEYSTLRKQEGSKAPGPIVRPEDVLTAIRNLERLFDLPEIEQALTVLYEHINDKNNPHNTTLDQFTQEVADIFYKEYKANGGTGSKAYYLECLFQTLRVATLAEMDTSNDPRLLISVKNAKLYLSKHEEDPNAHASLFDRILPGLPPRHAPTYALLGSTGMSYFNSTYSGAPFTYVGKDGLIHFSETGFAPTDYSTGEAAFACFKETTNQIAYSYDFSELYKENVTLMTDSDIDPTGNNTATAVFSIGSENDVQHMIATDPLELKAQTPHTFSIFAKSEGARYLCMSFQDLPDSDLTIRAIFDLESGDSIILNHLNRYTAYVQRLAGGWYRCCLTMFNEVGTIAPVILTFLKEKKRDYSLTFISEEECLGYIWGMQYEDNRVASPYIPTDGVTETRAAINYIIPLDESILDDKKYSLSMSWVESTSNRSKIADHPLLSIYDAEDMLSIRISQVTKNQIYVEHYYTLEREDDHYAALASQTKVAEQEDFKGRLTHSFVSGQEMLTCYNDTKVTEQAPLSYNKCKKLFFGSCGKKSFDGYLTSLVIYPCQMDESNMKFLHGEVIDG